MQGEFKGWVAQKSFGFIKADSYRSQPASTLKAPEPGGMCRPMGPECQPPTSLKIRPEKPPSTRPTPLASVKPAGRHE